MSLATMMMGGLGANVAAEGTGALSGRLLSAPGAADAGATKVAAGLEAAATDATVPTSVAGPLAATKPIEGAAVAAKLSEGLDASGTDLKGANASGRVSDNAGTIAGTPALSMPSVADLGVGTQSTIPKGFANASDFSSFGVNIRSGLNAAGYVDAEPVLQGSAVTGSSFETGKPFDSGRLSDLDVALASPSLLQAAKDAGIALRSGGTRTGPLSAKDLAVLGLSNLSNTISQQVGRPVNFMVYDSAVSAVARSPSITFPAH